jgi:DNA polymerase/3'-5' exonuclease PolX
LKEPDLEETVIDGWGVNENIEMIDRIARCANKLQRWGRRKRVKFKEEINTCVREMEALRDNQGEAESRRYQELSDRHATLLVQEEEYWKQRAKMHWLQEGDLNTRFFHMSASARGKKKKVTHLVDEAGTEVHTQEDLCEVAKHYFDTLFKYNSGIHEPVLNLIQPRVTEDDNHLLMAPLTKIEFQQALFQMHPNKSPGPDGFNPAFY